MKKFLMALPIFMLILLSSCGTKDKREVIRDYPLTSIKEDLKLDLVQNGKNLIKTWTRVRLILMFKLLKMQKIPCFIKQ